MGRGITDAELARRCDDRPELLDSGIKLLSTDVTQAQAIAAMSLRYPASSELSRFLYKLSEVSQQAADQFYLTALATYSGKPMREFLYLQAYPLGFRESGDMPVFGYYQVSPVSCPISCCSVDLSKRCCNARSKLCKPPWMTAITTTGSWDRPYPPGIDSCRAETGRTITRPVTYGGPCKRTNNGVTST